MSEKVKLKFLQKQLFKIKLAKWLTLIIMWAALVVIGLNLTLDLWILMIVALILWVSVYFFIRRSFRKQEKEIADQMLKIKSNIKN
jgi:type VI protein secretion system component VasF